MRARWLPLLLTGLLPACDSDPSAPATAGVVVSTSVDSTPTLSGPDVSFRAENRSSGAVYLARCGERIMAAVDRWEEGRWEIHSSDACQASLMSDPLRLAPGESAGSRQAVQIPGRYRLRLGVSSAPGAAPVWEAASAAFEITT